MAYYQPLILNLDDTRFIYHTNFSGDPSRDNFGDDRRKVNVKIPDEKQAMELMDKGFNIKVTRNSNDSPDFVPEYFVQAIIEFRNRDGSVKDVTRQPKVCLVRSGFPTRRMTETNISDLDHIRVANVSCQLREYYNELRGTHTFYVMNMYVVQRMDDDRYAERYGYSEGSDSQDEVPFE